MLHPEGHLYGRKAGPPTLFEAHRWQESGDYLFGIDLFNRGYFWEAHEAWEGLWRTARRESSERLLLHGLILAAAALLKREMGRDEGMRNLMQKALLRLQRVAGRHPSFCGINLAEWTQNLAQPHTKHIRIQLAEERFAPRRQDARP